MNFHLPMPIASAAVAVLQPYCPGLSPASLIEVLKSSKATPKASTMKPLTRQQAAAVLQVSLASINRRMKDGTLRWFKISPRLVRIDPASIEALMETVREITPAEPEA